MEYNKIPSDGIIEKTAGALREHGLEVFIAENGAAAKAKALEVLPAGAEVMTNSSTTGESIGLYKEIEESGKYDSVRKKFAGMDKSQAGRKRRLGAAPVWTVGSVQAVTQDGRVLVASVSGSQLPGYINGAAHVLWVVGAQKIVPDLDAGIRRIYDYVLPLEDARAMKAYGMHSGVNKMIILNNEATKGRVAMILVKEILGF